uniref:Uncharacterized protein n=1 Tax=Rhizophagus irregularis (strain DAOM 181602 / DAOM 197198 / MUCL 43194) TaxID=747089 RepID=U9TG72_RHIID
MYSFKYFIGKYSELFGRHTKTLQVCSNIVVFSLSKCRIKDYLILQKQPANNSHEVDIDFRGRRSRRRHTDNKKRQKTLKISFGTTLIGTGVHHEIQSSFSRDRNMNLIENQERWQLRRDDRVVPSSVLEKRSTDQVSCNQHKNTKMILLCRNCRLRRTLIYCSGIISL